MRKRKGGRGTLFCFPLFRHWCVPKRAEKRGGKFIRRAIFIVAVQFFWKKGKKGKKGWANLLEVTSFFFNSISRGRRCELTLSFRTVVNIFVRRESIEKNNVSFLSLFSHSPVGFHVGRGAVRRGKLRLLSILLALSRINFNDR